MLYNERQIITMKLKYVTAESREAAEARAAQHFGCDRNDITFEVINGEEEGAQQWTLLAITGAQAHEIYNMDCAYGVYYEPDGVYLELYECRGGGCQLDSQSLMQHLGRKRIEGTSVKAVQDLTTAGAGRARIANAQQEYVYGEDIHVEVSNDETEARARLLPPEPGGAAMDVAAAKQKLNAVGVVHGIDDQALAGLLEAKEYGEPRTVAVATPSEDGENGKLIFNFSTDERTGRPREIGGGRVDYRSLDLYVPVTEGQLLVTRTMATQGTPGMSVRGRELKQKPGKEVNLPRGKNVNTNPEKTEMSSMCSGMVQFMNNSINVSSVYKINGDCDLSVGNIEFDGSVHISGSVRSGHTIKATGGVIVGGTVEAATIIAGGNVEIKNGVQGADKGRIESGGSVTALYIERGTVIADGSITVDVSIHSQIETGGSLTAKGKRGAIIGGRAGAAGNIIANYIGAVSNTQTEVVVGVMMRKRERINFLEREIERLNNEMVKLDQLDAYLEKTKARMDKDTWGKLFKSGAENRRLNQESLEDCNAEVAVLKHELEHATEGKVHVFETAFHGARIMIGNNTYRVNDDISFATFRYRDGEIVYGTCELSKPK